MFEGLKRAHTYSFNYQFKKAYTHFHSALLQEPIGWFLHCCQLVVGKAQEMYDGDSEKEEEAPSLDKMLDMCDDLVMIMSKTSQTPKKP